MSARRLLQNLEVAADASGAFVGKSWDLGWGRLYGGQVVAQAAAAAKATLPESISPRKRMLHSLHSYFVRPGSIEEVHYHVETIRDGRSFSTREVKAYQRGKVIFTMQLSFQDHEVGLEHQEVDPIHVPSPEECKTREEYMQDVEHLLPERVKKAFTTPGPIVLRPTQPFRPLTPIAEAPSQSVWMKADSQVESDDPWQHQLLFAYASDFALLTTALLPHGESIWIPNRIKGASLCHSIYFHHPFAFDEYTLYRMTSPVASAGRGLAYGELLAPTGHLVASTVQQGIIRKLTPL